MALTACSSASTHESHTGTTGGETATAPLSATEGPIEAAPGSLPDASESTCANVRCMAGTHCEMVQVQCIRAPCPPLPQCVAD